MSTWVPRINDKVMAEVNDKMVMCYIQKIDVERRRNNYKMQGWMDNPARCWDDINVYVVRPVMDEFGKVNYSYKVEKVYQI